MAPPNNPYKYIFSYHSLSPTRCYLKIISTKWNGLVVKSRMSLMKSKTRKKGNEPVLSTNLISKPHIVPSFSYFTMARLDLSFVDVTYRIFLSQPSFLWTRFPIILLTTLHIILLTTLLAILLPTLHIILLTVWRCNWMFKPIEYYDSNCCYQFPHLSLLVEHWLLVCLE